MTNTQSSFIIIQKKKSKKKKIFLDNKYFWKNFRHFPKKSRAVIEVGAQRIGPQMSH